MSDKMVEEFSALLGEATLERLVSNKNKKFLQSKPYLDKYSKALENEMRKFVANKKDSAIKMLNKKRSGVYFYNLFEDLGGMDTLNKVTKSFFGKTFNEINAGEMGDILESTVNDTYVDVALGAYINGMSDYVKTLK